MTCAPPRGLTGRGLLKRLSNPNSLKYRRHRAGSVPSITRVIQALILSSAVLGVFFLWEAYPLLPPDVFYALTFGWLLFVFDGALTFVRPRVSYYLGLALAVVA